MEELTEITPVEFRDIEAEYKMALARRRRMIVRESRTMTQAEIARNWKLDISRINRIIKSRQPQKGQQKNVQR